MINTSRENTNPAMAGKTEEIKKASGVVRVSYDSFGREVSRRSDAGYWSYREYENQENNGEIIHYKNSDKRWWRKHYDANGRLLIVEDQTGRWFVINNSSHLVLYNTAADKYRVGSFVGTESEVRAHLCAPNKRYCPSILAAMSNVEWKKSQRKKRERKNWWSKAIQFFFG